MSLEILIKTSKMYEIHVWIQVFKKLFLTTTNHLKS